ncbi:NAD(+) diphosphatase [Leifsonella bigeumensis]
MTVVDARSGRNLARSVHPAPMPLSRSEVDRDYLSRARPQLIGELRGDPATRILPVWQGRSLVADPLPIGGENPALRLLEPSAIPDAETWLYLGRSLSTTTAEPPGTAILAAVLTETDAIALAPETEWAGLRELGAALSDRDAGLLVEAIALANWHASHRFSPRTGEPLVAEQGGWVLRAAGDTTEVFPRTDPAIIVAVLDEQDRLLLGSNALWQSNRYSLLAGFVEPGESLEAAVVREVFEESGIRVVDPVYLGSQPWPFPASIMLGFRAFADPRGAGELTPDGTEILDLRWFTREELRENESLILPGPTSIARAIIDEWLARP